MTAYERLKRAGDRAATFVACARPLGDRHAIVDEWLTARAAADIEVGLLAEGRIPPTSVLPGGLTVDDVRELRDVLQSLVKPIPPSVEEREACLAVLAKFEKALK